MSQQIIAIVEHLLAKAPQWIRQDLLAADPIIRRRAEEALAAMIGAALDETGVASMEDLAAAAS